MVDAHIAIIEHGKTTQILTIRSNTRWQIWELFIHERYMDENMVGVIYGDRNAGTHTVP